MSERRKKISRAMRFEILKRDGFKCRYCGRVADGAELHVDHIHPHSKGGIDDPINLATACVDCNSGKTNRELTEAIPSAEQHARLRRAREVEDELARVESLIEARRGTIAASSGRGRTSIRIENGEIKLVIDEGLTEAMVVAGAESRKFVASMTPDFARSLAAKLVAHAQILDGIRP